MEAQGINVHPCLATVTYLSANGGPTVILEKRVSITVVCLLVHLLKTRLFCACSSTPSVAVKFAEAWLARSLCRLLDRGFYSRRSFNTHGDHEPLADALRWPTLCRRLFPPLGAFPCMISASRRVAAAAAVSRCCYVFMIVTGIVDSRRFRHFAGGGAAVFCEKISNVVGARTRTATESRARTHLTCLIRKTTLHAGRGIGSGRTQAGLPPKLVYPTILASAIFRCCMRVRPGCCFISQRPKTQAQLF